MDFREFNGKVEKSLYVALLEVIMQPRRVLSVRDKIVDMGKVIEAYNNAFKELTGQDIEIEELIGVLKHDK